VNSDRWATVQRRIEALQQQVPDGRETAERTGLATTLADIQALAADLRRQQAELAAERATLTRLHATACEGEDRFAAAFHYAPIGMALVDLDGHPFQVNPALCALFGYSADELLSGALREVATPDETAAMRDYGKRLLAGKISSYQIEQRYRHRDGHVVEIQLSVSLVRGHDGRPPYFVCQVVDITARKRSESSLRESEARFSTAFEYAPVGMSLVGIDGVVLRVNRALCEMFGYSQEEMLAMPVWKSTHPDDMALTIDHLQRMVSGEQDTWHLEKRFLHRDGHIVWGISSASIVRGVDGHPLYVVSQVLDVTERKRTEAALREVEERFKQAFRFAPIGMALVGLDGRPLQINHALCDMLGYSEAELFPMAVAEVMVPDDLGSATADRQRLVNAELETYQAERRYYHKTGRIVWAQMSVSLVRASDGSPLYTISQMHDITARKEMEIALRRSEERFALAVAGANEVIVDWQIDTDELYASPRWCDLLGVDVPPTRLDQWLERIHIDDYERVHRDVGAHLEGQLAHYENEHRVRHADGTYRWVLSRGLCVRDADGRPYRMIGSLADISARKRAEEELRANEHRFRTLAETVNAGIFIATATNLGYGNRALESLTGYSRDEMTRMQVWDIVHPDDHAGVRERIRARRHGYDGRASYEVRIRTKQGDERWLDFCGALIEFDGQPAILGTAFDITERKRAEANLRYRLAFENLLATLASAFINLPPEQVDAGIVSALAAMGEFAGVDRTFVGLLSADQQTVDWTHLWCAPGAELQREDYHHVPVAQFAWTIERFSATGVLVLRSRDELPAAAATERAMLEVHGVQSLVEVPLVHQGGGIGVVGFSCVHRIREWSDEEISLLRIAAGMFANALHAKQTAEALQKSEERFALAVAGANDGVWDWSAQTNEAYYSPRWKSMLGYQDDEIANQFDEWRRRVHPDDQERAMADLLRHVSGLNTHYESEHRLLHRDGTYRHMLARGISLRDATGAVRRMVGSLTDITNRKRAEQDARQREAELAHVLRVTTMGEMASGLAHEINQPLSAIVNFARGCVRRLRAGHGVSPELLEALEQIASESLRAAEIIRRLRQFVRKEPPRREPVQLNELAVDVERLVEREAGELGIAVALDLDRHARLVQADAIQIEQVILNLVRNGFEAMHATPLVRRELVIRTACRRDGAVELAVTDRGEGLPQDGAAHIFEPFFTTKLNGLGMGLSISRSIIEAHGGHLWAESSPEGGTVFRFTLVPLAAGADDGP